MSARDNGFSAAEGVPDDELQSEGQQLIHFWRKLLVRRWPVVVIGGLVGLAASAWTQRDAPEIYSAEVTVQMERETTPLVGASSLRGEADRSLASEIAIIRTTSMLGPVIDTLGLQLTVLDDPTLRSDLFREIRINRAASAGEFRLSLEAGTLRLTVPDGELVATAPEGDILSGEGFILTVDRPALRAAGDVEVTIRPWDLTMQQLLRRLDIEELQGTNLIRIGFTSEDPVLAAAVPNAVATTYQRYTADRARVEATRRREFIEERLRTVADSLDHAQGELLEFQALARTVDPEEEGHALSQALRAEEARLRELGTNERTLVDLLTTFNTEDGGDEALRQMAILSGDFFPAAQSLYSRLQELKADRSRLTASPLTGRTENDPQVQLLDSLIHVTKVEMRAIASQSLELLRERKANREQRVRELETQVGAVPERNTAFGRLRQRVGAIQRLHDLLSERYYEAQIAEAVEAGNVEIVEMARMPLTPLPQNRIRNLLLGLLGGLILGTGLASLQEQLDTRVKNEEDAVNAAAVELIGSIPLMESRNGRERQIATEGWELEAFRMLRTNLRFVRTSPPRTLVITSPGPEDGKSVVAANLATSYSSEGARVLLIDADLRRPVQHQIFSIALEPGLSNVLIGEVGLDVVERVADEKLDLLSAGRAVPNPPELLGSPNFSSILEQASGRYDFVIIDAPPVLAVTDTSLIAPAVGREMGGVVLVSRFQRTDRRALAHAANQLRRTNAELFGVVFNGIRRSRMSGYSGYYGYGGHDEYYTKGKSSLGARHS